MRSPVQFAQKGLPECLSHGNVNLAFLRHSGSVFVPGAGEYLFAQWAKVLQYYQCSME